MKKSGIVLTILLVMGLLFVPLSSALATTDGYYQLSEVTPLAPAPPLWDGTDASRTRTPSADYDYTYGDEASLVYSLPWSFNFYGQSYDRINVDTNGNVWFGTTGSTHSFNIATNGRGPVIAAWNNDLSSYYYGGVFVQHKTDPERVVIEWQAETYTEAGYFLPNTFEAVLYKSGNIRIDYKSFTTATGKDFGSGVSKGSGDRYLNLTALYSSNLGVFTLAGRSFAFGDATAPTVTIDPVPSVVNASGQVLSGTKEEGTTVTVTDGTGASVGTVTYPTSTSWEFSITSLAPGNNTFIVKTTDIAGVSSASTTVTVNYRPPVTASVSPASIAADYKGTVGISAANLANSGDEILVEQLVDANRNGVADAADYLIRSFKVTDGTVSANPNVQGDEDGAANGAISTSLGFFLLNDLYHAPGHYIFRVTNGTDTATALFTVDPVSQAQTISGVVAAGGTPVPGAMVRLVDKWQRDAGTTIADGYGQYTLNVREPGEYLIMPSAYGHGTAASGIVPVTLAASQNIMNRDLTLVPGTYQVSGKVVDEASGAGIAGVWVEAKGAAYSGLAITGADGAYGLLLPAGQYQISAGSQATGPAPFAKGYAGYAGQAANVQLSGNVAGIDLSLPVGGVLVSGTMRDEFGLPLPGMLVRGKLPDSVDVREPLGYGISNAGGNYMLAINNGSNWNISLDETLAQMLGYIGNSIENFSTTSTPLTGNDLTAHVITAWVGGTVKDSDNNPLPGAGVRLRNEANSSINTMVKTASDGAYRMGAYAGNWRIDTWPQLAGFTSIPVTLANGQTAVMDLVAPTLTVNAVATPTTSNSQAITGTVAAGSTVAVTANTAASAGAVSYPTQTTWSCTVSGLVEGNNTITVSATNVADNWPALVSKTILLDTTPPASSASPAGGLLNPTTVTLSCNDGSGSGCGNIYYTTDSTPPTTASSIYSSPLPVTTNTTIKYFATDVNGNSGGVGSQTYTIDQDLPTGTVVINGGAAYTNSASVTLTLTCSDANDCARMQFSSDNQNWSAAEAYAATKAWTLAAGDGTKTVYARFTDTPGNTRTVNDSIALDTTPPTGTVVINNGAAATDSTSATLTLACSDVNGCTRMQFSNDNVNWSAAEPYVSTKAWTMPSGGGTKTVYAKFEDTAGNWSAAVNNSIMLETTSPGAIYPVKITNVATNYFKSVQLAYNAALDGDTIQCQAIELAENLSFDQDKTVNIVGGYTSDFAISTGVTRINGAMTLNAGKVSAQSIFLQRLIVDTAPPISSASPTGGLHAPLSVTLTCDDGEGSGCDRIYYTTDDAAPMTAFNIYSGPLSITATTTVRYFATDLSGNSEHYNSQTYTIDSLPPTGTVVINGGVAYTVSLDVTLALTCSDANNCVQMQFSNDNSNWSAAETYAATKTWTLTSGDGTKTVYARFTDPAGNGQVVNDTIIVETMPPTGTVAINGGAAATNSANVTLTLTCSDANGCAQMQLSNDNSNWSAAEPYAATKAWTLPAGDGTKTVYAKFEDTAGNWSAVVSDAILLDSSSSTVTDYPVKIANVATNYYASIQTAYNAALDGDTIQCKTGALTENLAFDQNKTVTLAGGYNSDFATSVGITRINGAMAINAGKVAAQSIFLQESNADTAPPATSASPPGGLYNTGQTVVLSCNDGAGSGCDKIYYAMGETAPFSIYSGPLSVTATTTIRYFATDLSGNSENNNSQTYTIDTVPPTGTVLINGGATATDVTSVTLTLSCNDASGCVEMQFSNDNVNWSAAEAYATIKAWALTPGDGLKTVNARFRDTAGNWSATDVYDIILYDTTPPTGTVTINGGAAATDSASVTLTLSCSDANGCGRMQFSNDNVTWSTAEAYAGTKTWTITAGDGTKTVYAKFIDSAEIFPATVSDTIVLDTTSQAGTTYPVKITNVATSYYTSLQAAYNAALDGDTVQCKAMELTENLIFGQNKTVNLLGGFNSDFTSSAEITTIHGTMAVEAGKVAAQSFILQ